jgi:hypothetical protein
MGVEAAAVDEILEELDALRYEPPDEPDADLE